MNTTFICLNSKKIAQLIDASKHEICFVSPGITSDIAAALVRCKNDFPDLTLEVIIDDDPNAIRFGYGSLEAIEILTKSGVSIRNQHGLRIGLISTDVASYIFNPTPQIIEEEPTSNSAPNAILIGEQEAGEIIQSIKTSDDLFKNDNKVEIGKEIFCDESIQIIKKDLENRPPIKPDLFRQMNVISSVFQLVETHLTGARVQAKTFTLSPQDLGIKNKEVANRIRASYKIIENAEILELSELESMHKNIKEQFFISVPKYGNLILYKRIKDFNSAIVLLKEEITNKKNTLCDEVRRKLEGSRNLLLPLIMENLKALPEDELRRIVFPLKPDQKGLKDFVTQKLEKKFPKAEKILSDIDLTVRITNVSSQLIEEEDFCKKIEEVFGKPFNEIVKIESAVEAKEY